MVLLFAIIRKKKIRKTQKEVIYTDSGFNRVVATELRPINGYVLVLKLVEPEYYQGTKILIPQSWKSDEYGIGIALSACGKIDVGMPILYGKYNMTQGLDELLYLPKPLSEKLKSMVDESNLRLLASYDEKLSSFTFINYHGIFAEIKDNKVIPLA